MRECLDFRSDERCRVGNIVEYYGKQYKIISIEEAFVVGRGILRAYVNIEEIKNDERR